MVAFLRILAILALLPLNVPAFAAAAAGHAPPAPESDNTPKRTCKCCHAEKPRPQQSRTPTKQHPKPLPAKPCCPHCCAVCSGSAIITPDHVSDPIADRSPSAWLAAVFTSVPHAGHRSLLDRPPRG